MKTAAFVGTVVLSLLSVTLVYCQECEVTPTELACFQTRFSRTENNVTDFTAFDIACADADFVAVQGGDVNFSDRTSLLATYFEIE